MSQTRAQYDRAEQSLPPYGEPASRKLLTHLPRLGFPYGSPPVKRDVGREIMNNSERTLLAAIVSGEQDLNAVESAIGSARTIEFLSALAETYKWDDGVRIPMKIAQHPLCGRGLALKLYWLAEGIALATGEIERNEYNNDWADLCELLAEGLANNKYQPGDMAFDPGLSKVQVFKLRKTDIPPVLYEATR